MRIEFEPALLEQTVFLGLRAERADLLPEYHRRSDKIYEEKDLDVRDAQFLALNQHFFSRLGYNSNVAKIVSHYPDLNTRLDALILLHCERSRDEDSELFCSPEQKFTALLRIRPETLISNSALQKIMLHELGHIDDMRNRAFGYSPNFSLPNINSEQAGIVRDRYRALWDLYIDARLNASQLPTGMPAHRHELSFMRLFGVSPLTEKIFSRLWQNLFTKPVTNASLIEAAQQPVALANLAGLNIDGETAASSVRQFAAVCPFCGCPTVHWATPEALADKSILDRIHARRPEWRSSDGICGQCIEYLKVPDTCKTLAGACI